MKTIQFMRDILGNVDVDIAIVIISIKFQSTKVFSLQINFYCIIFL